MQINNENTGQKNALELRGVCKRYMDFELDNVNITLPEGYIMGLIGENGAGKTTIIKSILGVINPDEGEIKLLGEDPKKSHGITGFAGAVLDELGLPEEATAADVELIMKNCYDGWDSSTFKSYLKKFGIAGKKKIKDYSKGMKMKLSIACALSHDSRILILDEATSGLDPVVREEVLDIIRDFIMDEKHSVLISSHILSDLEKICDYITYVKDGKVIFTEEKDILVEKYGILRCEKSSFEDIDKNAVISFIETDFGMEALVRKDMVNGAFCIDKAGIEDIMVWFSREEIK